MSSQHCAAVRIVVSMTAACLALTARGAELDPSELARCAAIAGGNERLACYDALAAAAVPGARIAPATVAAPAVPPAPAAAAVPRGPAALAAAPVAAAPAAHTADPDDPANFGLTRQQLKAVPQGPGSIKASVSEMTQDRLNTVSLVLDNGQIWKFVDPDPRLRPGDSVTIKRAALGSFLMTTPSRHSYRVERLR
jgi:hypothetical protein